MNRQAARLLAMIAAGSDAPVSDIEARRRGLEGLAKLGAPIETAEVRLEDRRIDLAGRSLRLRLYQPKDAESAGAVLFLHGGGWVAGGHQTHDAFLRLLAQSSGRTLIGLDYRLAPEHPFPAAFEDGVDALDALASEFGEMALSGDSAGGGLALAVALARPRSVEKLLLVSPIVSARPRHGSRKAFATGHFVEAASFLADLRAYAPDESLWDDPRLSPLLASDFSGLPPCQIHIAGFDPFRDEGEDLANRIGRAQLVRHDDQIHYFYALPGLIPAARTAIAGMGRFLAD